MRAPFRHAARVTVTARAGRRLEKMLLHRRGSAENSLQPEDIEYTFRHVLSKAEIEKVLKFVDSLERRDSTREFIAILAAPEIASSAW
ncbi:MAG TPA: hypothetical protein VIQ62_07125 [Burkholderiales bacterium]